MSRTVTAQRTPTVDPGAAPSAGILGMLAAPVTPAGALRDALGDLAVRGIAPLLERISYHRIDGLAFRAVSRLPQSGVHPWLRASLKRRHQLCAAATMVQGLGLAEVLDRLRAAGIPVAVTGGMRNVEWIYADRGSRHCDVHRLLIDDAARPRAAAVLHRLRFTTGAAGSFRRGGLRIALETDLPGTAGRRSGAGVSPLTMKRLLLRAAPGRVAGADVLLLSHEDELLLTAIEVVRRSFDRLFRIADLAHLLRFRGDTICWTALHETAAAWNMLRPLSLGLESTSLLGVPRPAGAWNDPAWRPLDRFLMRRARNLRPVNGGGAIVMALAAPRVSDGLRALFASMVPGHRPPHEEVAL